MACVNEHATALALLSLVYAAVRASGGRASPQVAQGAQLQPQPQAAAQPSQPQPSQPQPQAEEPDELESLVRHLGQQLRTTRWVEDELARNAAAGEPVKKLFEVAAVAGALGPQARPAQAVPPTPVLKPAPASGGCCSLA